jgi:hypothetical protein
MQIGSTSSLLTFCAEISAVTLVLRNSCGHGNCSRFDDYMGSIFPNCMFMIILIRLESRGHEEASRSVNFNWISISGSICADHVGGALAASTLQTQCALMRQPARRVPI